LDRLPDWWTPEMRAAFNLAAAFFPPIAVIPVGMDYLRERAERQSQRIAAMSDEAAASYPGTVDELLARLRSDERLQAIFDEAVDASARASTQAKARTIGRALASGALAADDAAVDEALLMMRVIRDLEPVDFRVLAHLARLTNPPVGAPRPTGLGLEFDGDDEVGHITAAGLAHEMGGAQMLMSVEASMPVLQRHGLVGSVIRYDSTGWRAIAFGLMILNYVSRHATTDPAGERDPLSASTKTQSR
jgi:hypothetical protein